MVRCKSKKYESTIGIHRFDGEYSDFPNSAKDPDEPDDLERCYAFDAGGRGRVGVQQQKTIGIACLTCMDISMIFRSTWRYFMGYLMISSYLRYL